jgi:hypothetical protein
MKHHGILWVVPVGPALLCAGVLGCATLDKEMTLSPEVSARRSLRTRVFESGDEVGILSACAALLQDAGYIIEENDAGVGLITASKTRGHGVETKEAAQLMMLSALQMAGGQMPTVYWQAKGETEVLRACVSTRPLGGDRTAVRVDLLRVVLNSQGMPTGIHPIGVLDEPTLYEEFFSRLSKAVFLEAQGL